MFHKGKEQCFLRLPLLKPLFRKYVPDIVDSTPLYQWMWYDVRWVLYPLKWQCQYSTQSWVIE